MFVLLHSSPVNYSFFSNAVLYCAKGHYYAYLLNFFTNTWYKLDDATVTEVEECVVLNDAYSGKSCACALEYIRCNSSVAEKTTESDRIIGSESFPLEKPVPSASALQSSIPSWREGHRAWAKIGSSGAGEDVCTVLSVEPEGILIRYDTSGSKFLVTNPERLRLMEEAVKTADSRGRPVRRSGRAAAMAAAAAPLTGIPVPKRKPIVRRPGPVNKPTPRGSHSS